MHDTPGAKTLPVVDTVFRTVCRNLLSLNDELRTMTTELPVGPVDAMALRLDFNTESLLSDISTMGTVIAPSCVFARHVEARNLPKYANPGRFLRFHLVLSEDYSSVAPAELEGAAASLVLHGHVDAVLVCREECQPLFVTLAPAAGGRGVVVSVAVPASAGRDSRVSIRRICYAGQPVTYEQSLPVQLAVLTGNARTRAL
jgi:hypothetical protein